ncbi:MAG: hypothetical protein LBM74_02535 [Oscillospiraceae bacterium]|jgi:hypothetical protein|nr:hypothetical protein [Oscillospiraceae bacterium]
MPQTPYELIKKANRGVTSADRWATLQANAQDRKPLTPPPSAQPTDAAPAAPASASSGIPPMMQPPFPPPQPRHQIIDDIALRHIQAVKTAGQMKQWTAPSASPPPPPAPPPKPPEE